MGINKKFLVWLTDKKVLFHSRQMTYKERLLWAQYQRPMSPVLWNGALLWHLPLQTFWFQFLLLLIFLAIQNNQIFNVLCDVFTTKEVLYLHNPQHLKVIILYSCFIRFLQRCNWSRLQKSEQNVWWGKHTNIFKDFPR